MKRVGVRRGARTLVLVGIVGVVTLGLAAQASAILCVAPTPVFAGGGAPGVQSSTNKSIATEVGPVSIGDTVVVSVATGTHTGPLPDVGCTDNASNTYTVVADKNTGNGRLFVCSFKVVAPVPTPYYVTATYPQFSGLSVTNALAIPGVGAPGASSTNSGSNPAVTSGTVTVTSDTLLVGVVANGGASTLFFGNSPPSGFTQLNNTQVFAGASRRNVTPLYKRVSSGFPQNVGVTGTLDGSASWQAVIIPYPVIPCP